MPQSEQTLADFARDAAAQREEYASRRKAEREAVENPKTLEDFRSFIRFHMDEGKTAGEARDLLSFEQREQFDRLAAEASRSTQKNKGGTCPFLLVPDHWRRNHCHKAYAERT